MINKIKALKHKLYLHQKFQADEKFRDSVSSILHSDNAPDTRKSEAAFEQLQSSYPSNRGDFYKYDDFSLFERASQRASKLLQLEGMSDPGKLVLDVGAGDGTLGALLNTYGHKVTLTDMEDWRSQMAQSVNFTPSNISDGLPFEANFFDLVISFNCFEHFPDPAKALSEIIRVLKPRGMAYFDFGPLYCSPWGLHAYRSLYMPYSQFLFSEDFVNAKLNELGITDLGKKRMELQFMNKWRAFEFENLLNASELQIRCCHFGRLNEHLDLVLLYPEAFKGRNLTINDLTIASMCIEIQK